MEQQKRQKLKNQLILLVLIVVASQLSFAPNVLAISATEYNWQSIGVDTSFKRWSSIAGSTSLQKLVAVSDRGAYTSSDGAHSWTIVPGSEQQRWNSASSSGDGSIFVITPSGTAGQPFRITYNSGATWSNVTAPNGTSASFDAIIDATGMFLYAYDQQNLYVTSDYGQTWLIRSNLSTNCSSGYQVSLAASADMTKMMLACATNANVPLYVSSDSGASWTGVGSLGNVKYWLKPVMSSDGSVMFVSKDYTNSVYGSYDGGTTWTQYPNLYNAAGTSTNGGTIIGNAQWVIDNPQAALLSTDSGTSWSQPSTLSRSGDNWSKALITSDRQHIVAMPGIGSITYSDDGGLTWRTAGTVTNPRNEWSEIAVSRDGQILYAVNWSTGGNIYKSSDGGATWIPLVNSGYRYWDNVATSGDGQLVVAAQGYTWNAGYLHISHDGGATWTTALNDHERNWIRIAISDDGHSVIAVANENTSSGGVFISHDGGITWSDKSAQISGRPTSVALSRDGKYAVIAGYNTPLHISSDAGETWQAQVSSGSRDWVDLACSADCSTILAGSNVGYFYLSYDRGVTWQEHQELGSKRWGSLALSADGKRAAIAEYWHTTPVYLSNDSGHTWVQQTNTTSVDDNWMGFNFSADGSILYGVTGTWGATEQSGRIFKGTLSTEQPIAPIVLHNDVVSSNYIIAGTATPGSKVILRFADGQIMTMSVDFSGLFSFTLPDTIKPGDALTLTQENAAGVLSAPQFVTVGGSLAATGQNTTFFQSLAAVLGALSLFTFIRTSGKHKNKWR